MRRSLALAILAGWLLACGTISSPLAWAQSEPSTAPPIRTASDVLLRGQELESGQRWGEALTHYEEAMREHPADPAISQRFQLSKIHYGLVRRYNDASFRKSIGDLGENEAVELYNEVLIKLQSHYVADPNWRSLIVDGSRGLRVALTNDVFRKEHLQTAQDANLVSFDRDLSRQVDGRDIRDRMAAVDSVRMAIRVGYHHLRLPPAAVAMEYVQRAVASLDDYSTYLTSSQLNELYSQIDGNFVGLGIELQTDQGFLTVVKVIPGSPAASAGMLAGDRIISVDGTPTEGMSTEKAAGMLQGLENSVVEVGLRSPANQVRVIRARRQHVEVPSIDLVKIIDAASGVGYIRMTSFQKTTTRELDEALWSLHRQGMRSLVLDLRGNPGGLLTTSVEVADRFLTSGRIVSTRGRSADQNWTYSAHPEGTWRMPLAVLIDRDSASASEIFAGAIRDHRRGVIVGQNSYGKGSVQSIFSLNYAGAGLRLTTAKFYSPLGYPYAKIGVAPNVTVQQVAKPVNGELPKPVELAQDTVVIEAIRAVKDLPIASN